MNGVHGVVVLVFPGELRSMQMSSDTTKIVERGGLESLFKSVFELFSSVKTQSRDNV